MISVIVTTIFSFVSTNIDDIFVLMLFFSRVGEQLQRNHIIIGQYLGIITLILISILGSSGLTIIPQQYSGLLGIVPILLGIKEWLEYRKDKKDGVRLNEIEAKELTIKEKLTSKENVISDIHIDLIQAKMKGVLNKLIHPGVLNVFLVAIANGVDNIGVYIPLFSRLNVFELIVTIIIFLLLTAVWCIIGERLINFPRIRQTIQKYKDIVVPVTFIVIGILILSDSHLFF